MLLGGDATTKEANPDYSKNVELKKVEEEEKAKQTPAPTPAPTTGNNNNNSGGNNNGGNNGGNNGNNNGGNSGGNSGTAPTATPRQVTIAMPDFVGKNREVYNDWVKWAKRIRRQTISFH